MKKNLAAFLAGAVTATLLIALPVSALAATGCLTLEVDPIHIQVNGEVFQPKDAQGNDVLVFSYNGTTYAPLRALAEAYGLEVGYDAATNTATVNDSAQTKTGYEDFAALWTVKEKPVTNYGDEKVFEAKYAGPLDMGGFKEWWKGLDDTTIRGYANQMAEGLKAENPGYTATVYFSYGTYQLGIAYALNGYTISNFNLATAWVK